ncbi:Hypothetical protein CINCED_3A022208, partial [Cinara cedri]
MPFKRLCHFNEKLQNDFPFIKKLKSTDDFNVQYTTYHVTFPVSHGGRSDINDHLKTQKHKLATMTSVQSGKVSNYFSALVPTESKTMKSHEWLRLKSDWRSQILIHCQDRRDLSKI